MGYFRDRENSAPAELLDALAARADLPGWLGNRHASGTTIIAELGEEHVRTGKPIVYTSADSVLQIAAHETAFGLERLYRLCALAREMVDAYRIGRVIARPFLGQDAGGFRRSHQSPRLFDAADDADPAGPAVRGRRRGAWRRQDSGHLRPQRHFARGQGAWPGRPVRRHAGDLAGCADRGLVFTNFVDFDSEYGHRRDVAGYARALEQFDRRIPELLAALAPDDLLILSADHGNDPTWPGSDHTREHVPILAIGAGLPAGGIGLRDSFADIGQSLAEHLGLPSMRYGQAFLERP